MRLLHVSPTWFGRGSVVGGGERYALELARACASRAETTLLSYAGEASERADGSLRLRFLASRPRPAGDLAASPFAAGLYGEIARADVVHCHQADTYVTSAAIVAARVLGRRVFVTDLGGGHPHAPSLRLPVLPRATGMLLLSEYSRRQWIEAPRFRRPRRTAVVYGGVARPFAPSGTVNRNQVLFVGRIIRHKGIEHAIGALDPDMRLIVAGVPYDAPYAAMLRETAHGHSVEFREGVEDAELPALYGSSLATVVPSVYRAWGGSETAVPELLGLVALESMACGTPVIVSSAGSLPELVEDGVTGFVVPPNDASAIRRAIRTLMSDPARRDDMGRRARETVLARFTWDATAARCFEAYTA